MKMHLKNNSSLLLANSTVFNSAGINSNAGVANTAPVFIRDITPASLGIRIKHNACRDSYYVDGKYFPCAGDAINIWIKRLKPVIVNVPEYKLRRLIIDACKWQDSIDFLLNSCEITIHKINDLNFHIGKCYSLKFDDKSPVVWADAIERYSRDRIWQFKFFQECAIDAANEIEQLKSLQAQIMAFKSDYPAVFDAILNAAEGRDTGCNQNIALTEDILSRGFGCTVDVDAKWLARALSTDLIAKFENFSLTPNLCIDEYAVPPEDYATDIDAAIECEYELAGLKLHTAEQFNAVLDNLHLSGKHAPVSYFRYAYMKLFDEVSKVVSIADITRERSLDKYQRERYLEPFAKIARYFNGYVLATDTGFRFTTELDAVNFANVAQAYIGNSCKAKFGSACRYRAYRFED